MAEHPLYRKWKHIGYYSDIKDAVNARIQAEIELFGEQKMNLEVKGGFKNG